MLNLHDLRLADVMTASPLSFTLDTPVDEACRTLINESVLAAPVFDDDSQETLEVSVAELLEFTIDSARDGFESTLRNLDLKPALCLPAEFSLPRACQEMIRRGARRILVGRPGHPEGILSATDIVRAVACLESCNQTPVAGARVPEWTLRLRDVMRQDVIATSPE